MGALAARAAGPVGHANYMAERGGFEPPIPVKVWPLSRRLVSTTHAPLRAVKNRGLKNILAGVAEIVGSTAPGLNAAIFFGGRTPAGYLSIFRQARRL